MYGVTRERVRQIELHALRRLQKEFINMFGISCDAQKNLARQKLLSRGYDDIFCDGVYLGRCNR